jgi:hypothetical protein
MASDTHEFYVLECNPRTWSSMNASILNGFNFIDVAVSEILSLPPHSRIHTKETYVKFRKSLKVLLTQPWKFLRYSSVSRKDFVSVLKDPIPYLVLAIRQGKIVLMRDFRGRWFLIISL